MRVAITNDNDANRTILMHIIDKLTEHDVAWIAKSGNESIIKCQQDTPDLILMDMIMPKTNGVQASLEIMKETPCAILIVTASVTENASMIFEAMSYGALDVVKTPFSGVANSKTEISDFLKKLNTINKLIKADEKKSFVKNNIPKNNPIIVLGSSTGGPGVLAKILAKIPEDFPAPIIIVQHVDSSFSHNFSSWLDKQSKIEVKVATEGDVPQAGVAFIAGKSEHLVMNSSKRLIYSELSKELIYKPSVDVFFESVAKHWKGNIIAGLLTGMGKDGAQGLASIHRLGGHTITQTEASCAVYGMPKAADDMGVSSQSLEPEEIANSIIEHVYGNN